MPSRTKTTHLDLQCLEKNREDGDRYVVSEEMLEGDLAMFQEKIAQHYSRLGKNQKKIADFLTRQYHEAAFVNPFALSQ